MASAPPSFKKNYYAILGLETPTWRTSTVLDPFDLKSAYRRALLAAHPDKHSARRQRAQKGGLVYPTAALNARFGTAKSAERYEYGDYGYGGGVSGEYKREEYTVDDVKEAFQMLSRTAVRVEYDKWLAATYEAGVLRYGDGERGLEEAFSTSPSASRSQSSRGGGGGGAEGVLGTGVGLESLDLSDFEIVSVAASTVAGSGVSTPAASSSSASVVLDGDGEAGEEEQEWRRECRCGHTTGFKITEASLAYAEETGEKEVLVGCEGCSLWVRVTFDVEEEGR